MRVEPTCPKGGHYEIVVRHHLGNVLRQAFPELTGVERDEQTVLSGHLPDQAALFGVLRRIESLNLELVALRRLPRAAGQNHGPRCPGP